MAGLITRRAALASAALLPLAAHAQAAPWPSAPVRFIGLFPPGGGTDILSRIWCAKMADITNQQFIVENRSGSGGNVGTHAIAQSRNDGSVIGLASVSSLAISPTLYSSLPFDVTRDFSYLGGLWQLPNMLVVHNDVAARSIPELIALLKANPGRYSFASSGSGTSVHLSGEMFKQMAGVDIIHVPYRGAAPAHIDLLAGRVHMIFDNIPQALAAHRGGTLRALAVTGAQRSPQAPEVPAMAEFLPGFEITSWGGVLGPAGMAPALVNRIASLTKQAVETRKVTERYIENGATPWPIGPEELAAFRAADAARFAPLIRASGARVE
ncbi:Bug family tripartite tricarboxylate transporter substrate binding protein [Plastoroseomonas arctica]|uniref:Tripartite tricarboxylate transporter substrate binding protein n=1 Tax=Plastoroseomonas arctica TaxID=1509237 RepID=A0AAF1KP53_9PROT|nr:tripartite tricarboxylate transporter substrate binding protein [Plastoroseomonas arctica]MBR0657059.1 tripartite tricarboxylate transporter substrate binding protein [Plastoroseomonas arctica]